MIFTRFLDELDLFVPTAPTPDTENTTLLSELSNTLSADPLESNFDEIGRASCRERV